MPPPAAKVPAGGTSSTPVSRLIPDIYFLSILLIFGLLELFNIVEIQYSPSPREFLGICFKYAFCLFICFCIYISCLVPMEA
jgi:hypothetical protein